MSLTFETLMIKSSFPYSKQVNLSDCGPTCLKMIAKYYGKEYALETLRDLSHITREGVSFLGIKDAAECIGMKTMGVKVSVEQLCHNTLFPCIIHWNQNHFVVLYKIKEKGKGRYLFYIADPASKKLVYNLEEFKKCWVSDSGASEETGMALLLEPGLDFESVEDERQVSNSMTNFFLAYLNPYRLKISIYINIYN